LRHVLQLAIDRGLIARNPALEIAKVKVPANKLELPSSEQFRQIVEHIRSSKQRTGQGSADLVEFLAYSGCRISEAIKVRWPDIDTVRGRIWIAPGKNSTARHVPLLDSMRDLLDRIKAKPRFYKSQPRMNGGYIISVAQCARMLTAAYKKAEAHRITHHDLRHLFATRCIESGVDIPTVSR
jgi:integrase